MAIDTTETTSASHPSPLEQSRPGTRLSTRDKLVLFVLCAAQFMVALDF
ncbi:MFS transporter, partial [Streptomyces sp. NPDC058476]